MYNKSKKRLWRWARKQKRQRTLPMHAYPAMADNRWKPSRFHHLETAWGVEKRKGLDE